MSVGITYKDRYIACITDKALSEEETSNLLVLSIKFD